MPTFTQAAALTVALLGCVTDLRSRRIPNVLTFGAAAGAFGFHLADAGLTGLGWSAVGWITGLALFLPFFLLRGIGGGDVKLLAAIGAWVGAGAVVWLAIYAALAGGVMALVVALSAGYLGQAFRNVWSLLMFWRVAGLRPHPGLTLDSPGAPRLPYAVPIAAGLVVTLWLR
jgi:prepilin peptidase CpaA